MNYYIKFGRLTYHLETVVSILTIGLLIYFELRGGRSYFDEGLALVCILYVTMLFLKKRLDATDQVSVILLFAVIVIGILSNIMSKLAYSCFSIFVDIISETKFLWTLFAFKYYITSDVYDEMSRVLRPAAKWFCYLACVFAVVSQFVNIGMTGAVR